MLLPAALLAVSLACSIQELAEQCEQAIREWTPEEKAFVEKARALVATLPPAPAGWKVAGDYLVRPGSMVGLNPVEPKVTCRDRVRAPVTGASPLDIEVSRIYQRADFAERQRKAAEAARQATAAQVPTVEAWREFLRQRHELLDDAQASVSIDVNSSSASSAPAATPFAVEGGAAAWRETCFSCSSRETAVDKLLLGPWAKDATGPGALAFKSAFAASAPGTRVQTLFVSTYAGSRTTADALLAGVRVAELAAALAH